MAASTKDTKGFFEKYFEEKAWSDTAEPVVQTANPHVVYGRRVDFS